MEMFAGHLIRAIPQNVFYYRIGISVAALGVYLPYPVGYPFSQISKSSFRCAQCLLKLPFASHILNDTGKQGKKIRGFNQIIPGPQFHGLHSNILIPLAGDHDDRDILILSI